MFSYQFVFVIVLVLLQFAFVFHQIVCIFVLYQSIFVLVFYQEASIWGSCGRWSAGLNNQPCFLIRIDQVNIKYTIYAIHEISSELKDSWPVLQITCYSVSFQKNCMDPLRIKSPVQDAGYFYGYRFFLAMIRKVWKRIQAKVL